MLTLQLACAALAALSAGVELEAPEDAGPPSPPALRLDIPISLATSGGALALAGASELWKKQLAPSRCRWCAPDGLDRRLRSDLRWHDTAAASTASDVLQLGVPLVSALALGLMDLHAGDQRAAGEDALVVGEAVSVVVLLGQVAKLSSSRLRPDAWARGGTPRSSDLTSFWSDHTAATFAAAAAATQTARLRGRPGWRWLGLALAGALATGYLRLAADRHWTTDVLAGAAVGTAVGLAIPPLVLHPGPAG